MRENDWMLVVQVPKAKAYAPLFRARLILSGIMVLALSLIIYLVIRNTRGLVGKLEAADTAKEDLRAQLFSAAKLASVGEMAAGVAHEINNPLAIIYEEVGMIKDILDPQFKQELNNEDLRERMQAITDAAMRGRAITSKLLAFSRRHDPTPEASDLNLLLMRVLAVKESEFRVSNIEVKTEYTDALPEVMINRNQIDQVILNLLHNARDAIITQAPHGTITMRSGLEDGWVYAEIQDTGCGMTDEQMQKIFFPFFTTKGVGKGTGLGLSISYGIIKSHGGRIEVESEQGVGSTFRVMFPKARVQTAKGAGEEGKEQRR
jgi:two-component system NtrC family sensor kinase